ncbi:MAG: quinol:cytochrome C oxidoreductase, partial [Phycisphaeraceae bacterium]
QDETGEPGLTVRMERLSPVAVLAFAVTLTFAAFDLLMSLDPKWYSTIFGVYYFSGAFLGAVSTMILSIVGLKRLGMLKVVDEDHLHDLGKWLFAFVFFWGYIAFSQYMLIWYANLPETTYWFDLRGMTTVPERITGWTGVALALLIGHLLIPFAGLLSRHVKRRGGLLALWAAWLLVFHWLDLYWVVMPLYSRAWLVPIVEVLAVIGLAGLYFGAVVHRAADHSLVPAKDPRMGESLSFENV